MTILVAAAVISAPHGDPIPALAAKISPAVVAVECDILIEVTDEEAGTTMLLPAVAAGSGVIVTGDGLIVTNHHVVEDAISIHVTLYNGTRAQARLLGSDPDADLAVLEIAGSGYPHLPAGGADSLALGQSVVSMGNGHGLGRNGDLSLTAGVVSGLRRPVGSGRVWYEMDAPIYPGCSGGPVCDMSGRVVGINVAVSSFLKPFFIPLDRANMEVLRRLSSGRIR